MTDCGLECGVRSLEEEEVILRRLCTSFRKQFPTCNPCNNTVLRLVWTALSHQYGSSTITQAFADELKQYRAEQKQTKRKESQSIPLTTVPTRPSPRLSMAEKNNQKPSIPTQPSSTYDVPRMNAAKYAARNKPTENVTEWHSERDEIEEELDEKDTHEQALHNIAQHMLSGMNFGGMPSPFSQFFAPPALVIVQGKHIDRAVPKEPNTDKIEEVPDEPHNPQTAPSRTENPTSSNSEKGSHTNCITYEDKRVTNVELPAETNAKNNDGQTSNEYVQSTRVDSNFCQTETNSTFPHECNLPTPHIPLTLNMFRKHGEPIAETKEKVAEITSKCTATESQDLIASFSTLPTPSDLPPLSKNTVTLDHHIQRVQTLMNDYTRKYETCLAILKRTELFTEAQICEYRTYVERTYNELIAARKQLEQLIQERQQYVLV